METLALHGDPALGATVGAQALPICQTAAFDFASAEQAARRFSLDDAGPIYSRLGNPTVAAFEQRMAALEGGVGALATSSGQAAVFYALAALSTPGDNIVASTSLYGGVYSLLTNILGSFGIETRFVPVTDMRAWDRSMDSRTTCAYAEIIGNPLLDTPDLSSLSALAHERSVPLIIDNTLATACLCRPFEHGADVVVYSATKYICGHGTTIGGAIVDSGHFDWRRARTRGLTQPDAQYADVVFADRFGPDAYLAYIRAHWLRDVGACMAPETAWNLVQGIETLPIRMERHSENAAALSQWLAGHPATERVIYPAREDHPTRSCADQYLRRSGGMIGLCVRGGYDAAKRVVSRVRVFSHAANMGDAKSLVIHPASTTHANVPAPVRNELGIAENFLRLSVGLEHIDDLKDDLDHALAATRYRPRERPDVRRRLHTPTHRTR